MNRKSAASMIVLTLFTWSTAAMAAPPVDVNVSVEEEDEAPQGDFFDDPPKKRRSGVRGNADDAFEALEREEAKRGPSVEVSGKEGGNTNTQVVNIVVTGNQQEGAEAKADAKADAKSDSKSDAEATAPPAPPAPPAPSYSTPTPPPPPKMLHAKHRKKKARRRWRPEQGDMMLFGTVGGYSSGGMLGMGLEAYATDVIGIRLTGQIGGYGDEYDHHDGGRLFDGDSSWVPTSGNGNVESAVAHLVDLSLTAHLRPGSIFDPYLALGLSHYGYDILYSDSHERGGAGYTRLGGGVNLHLGRFIAGVDAGWYPLEFVRYRIDEGRRGEDPEAVGQEIEEPFAADRFTVSAHIGWRFF